MSNAPSAPSALYGHAFFPFPAALHVHEGERLSVEFRAHLVHGDYLWQWNTTHTPREGAPVVFRQTNLAARVVALNQLRPPGSAGDGGDVRSSTIPSTD
jgi:hypothetical protein